MHPLQVTKFEMNLNQVSTSNKRRQLKDISLKRFKNNLKKKSINQPETPIMLNDISYVDRTSNSFYKISGNTPTSQSKTKNQKSNLLKSQYFISPMSSKKSTINPQSLETNEKKTSTKYLSGAMLHDSNSSLCASVERIKPKTSREFRSSYSRQQQDQQKQKQKKQASKINPYTKREYLYFRKKEKQKIKRTMEEIHKKQMFIHILRPCQIEKKELKQRENIRYHQNKEKMDNLKKKYSRPQTSLQKNNEGTHEVFLEPWEIHPYESDF